MIGLYLISRKFLYQKSLLKSDLSQVGLKEKELELRYRQKMQDLELLEKKLQKQAKKLQKNQEENQNIQNKLLEQEKCYTHLIEQNHQEKERLKELFGNYLGMNENEVKKELLKLYEEDLIAHKGKMIRYHENELKNELKKRANFMIAQATTRYAGEFAQERLINVVTLPNDELKGRIIGKDGRNIKTFEMITGVDVIIDDTPLTIVLSSFNLYRRAIATKVLEELIEDGRIQPLRIEEIFKRVSEEMQERLLQDGEEVVLDLGLGYMHPELKKMIGRLKYRASFGQNTLGHSLEVANLASVIAEELGGDARLARRAGILHDIGKAMTQDFGGNHVELGYEICLKYQEDPVVLNAIKAHHDYEEPRSIEAAAVCCADTLSAARPGARREALESFLKRAVELEAIAMKKRSVKQAYVINAGKEIRVIVDALVIDDAECAVLAREIAKEIEEGFHYPGEIKVHMIRESRVIEIAH